MGTDVRTELGAKLPAGPHAAHGNAHLPVPRSQDPENRPIQSTEELSDLITKTFCKGRDLVKEGQKTASVGKTLMWCAAAGLALSAIAAGAVVVGTTGVLAAGVLTLAAAGASIYGGKRLLGLTVATFAAGKTIRGVGIFKQRTGNNAMARCITANTDLTYYNTNHSVESENINAMRHGLSNRGEFFYPVSAQSGVEAEIMKINISMEQTRAQSIGTYIGGAMGVIKELVTNPIGQAKELIEAAKRK